MHAKAINYVVHKHGQKYKIDRFIFVHKQDFMVEIKKKKKKKTLITAGRW